MVMKQLKEHLRKQQQPAITHQTLSCFALYLIYFLQPLHFCAGVMSELELRKHE